MGRDDMQKTDHDRDISYQQQNPAPGKYAPVIPGKELARDAVKFTF